MLVHVLVPTATLSKFLGMSSFASFCAIRLKKTDISDGRIQDTSGEVIYKVKFNALVFRPFKGEILDGIVTDVHSDGFHLQSGPLKSFVS